MKLQKNTLLALYSVLEFAANPGRQLSAAEVAAKYRISPHHLAKVLRTLGRARLVAAVRGVGGGYRFAGNAKRLTLMDVIERNVALAISSISASTTPSASSTSCGAAMLSVAARRRCAPFAGARRGALMSSNSSITSIKVSRLALPANR